MAVVPQPNTRSNIEVTKPQTFNGAVNKVWSSEYHASYL